jgi:ABC-type uncharacterized transport system involved in gliding motility auxiliary subunit
VSILSEPLTINVFFTKNLPAPHNNTERYLHDLLQEYAIYGNEYFNYRFYDVSPEEGDVDEETKVNQEVARNYGIHPVQMQVIEEDEVKFQKAYMGLVLIHGDLIERIPAITSTDGLEYDITAAIQKLNNKISALLRLRDKIQVKLYLSSSLKVVAPYMRLNQLPDLPQELEGIVDKLNDKNYGKLEFQHLDPAQDGDLLPALEEHNIMKIKWPALSNGKIPAGEGAIGLVMEYGEKAVDIPLMHVIRIPLIGKHYELVDLNSMEEIVNESVESLIDINQDLGYLASHGTLKRFGASPANPMAQQEALSNFQDLASQGYTIKDIDLEEGPVPESVNCLVVPRPTETFSDYELFQLDQFLMRGNNLALFLDAFKEVQEPKDRQMSFHPGPTYEPLNTGLEKLLEHYGVRIKESYVLDENCYKQRMPERFGGGEQAVYFAPIIKNQAINHDLGFVSNIKGLITMKISPLELDTERIQENGLTAHRVFSSSDQAWEMKGRINLNPMFIRPPQSDDEKKTMPLAYVLEGQFPSYFAGKPIPEKETEKDDAEEDEDQEPEEAADKKPEVDLSKIEDERAFLSKGKPGKVFVIATSEMLKDNMLDEAGRSPNAMFVMNVLDYLNNREEIADMRSKEQLFNPLDDTTAGTKTFVKSFNIVGLPVLVVLFGLLVWFRRHSRKKRIQMMFQK